MKPRLALLACCLVLLSTLGPPRANPSAFGAGRREPRPSRVESPVHGARLRRRAVRRRRRGLFAFFDRRLRDLGANGRSCADCHMATDHFQLSPANADARFQFLQLLRRSNPDADDPLFRPIDADDFRTNGEDASDFSNLRQNGLIASSSRCRRT